MLRKSFIRVTTTVFSLILLCISVIGVHAQYNKEYFYWVGRNNMMENNYQGAIQVLNTLLRVDESAYEGYFLRGIAKYNLNDLIGADTDFSVAIDKNPVFTAAYVNRAITRSRLGNYDDALKDFEQAIELRPDLPNPYYSRGVTRLLNRQFTEAIEDFNQFIKQETKVADAYLNRGMCYLQLQDTTAAYDDFTLAIRTNRESPDAYNRRGSLYMEQKNYAAAERDFNSAIAHDSTSLLSYFNRALVYNGTKRPMQSLSDFDRVIELDSTNSLTYFNRAIVRTQVGDYNNALDDYNKVAHYSPENVLVYFYRANLLSQLGEIVDAEKDYSRAIELYPDFANAYMSRGHLRSILKDNKGAESDRKIAEQKIAQHKSKLQDSTYSIYADTAYRFDRLLSFDTNLTGSTFERITSRDSRAEGLSLIPLFRFTLNHSDSLSLPSVTRYYSRRMDDFKSLIDNSLLNISCKESNIAADELVILDKEYADNIKKSSTDNWMFLFERAISQGLIKQYTNSVNTYTSAIELNPANPFLYLNRSTTRAEMIDFISSIDNAYQRISIDSDPANRLNNNSTRTYNYDESIADLNKVIALYPDFAYAYYNRANLLALSGELPKAYDDYSRAIAIYPDFAEAFYNRGLIQIFMKDTRKGCIDMSKAGELGIETAYKVLDQYARENNKEN